MSSLLKRWLAGLILLMLIPVCAWGEGTLGDPTLGEAVSVRRTNDEIERMERPAEHTVAEKVRNIPHPEKEEASMAPVVMGASANSSSPDTLTGGKSREEMTREFVTRMYQVVLKRSPDAAGLTEWTNTLLNGTATAADIVTGMFNSNEYQNNHKSNQQIVTDCYLAMMGRSPDPAGLAAWVDALNIGMTSQAILAGFVGSQEFQALAATYGIQPGTVRLYSARDESYGRTYFVYRLYNNCLRRAPDPAGQESWCRALSNNATGSQAASGFIFSQEMESLHLTNKDFIKMLYDTILGRSPDASGLQVWTDVLNFSNTRERVFNGFLFSPEFALQCASSGINVGNPIKDIDDEEDWQINVFVLAIVNDYRSSANLPVLTTREDLWRDVSRVRAREISVYPSSYRPNKEWWLTVLTEAGLGVHSDAYEIYCNNYDNIFTFLFEERNKSLLSKVYYSTEYENMATAFIPEGSWELVLYTP